MGMAVEGAVAFVLPSCRDSMAGELLEESEVVIGGSGRDGTLAAGDGLKLVSETLPHRVVVHEDQLVDPGVANVLVRTDDFVGFVSPVAVLLNRKYGYSLDIWTGGDRVRLGPGSEVGEITRGLVTHLRACRSLGSEWEVLRSQRMRMASVRDEIRGRKLRFVRSSIAAAFGSEPSSEGAGMLHAEIRCLKERIGA